MALEEGEVMLRMGGTVPPIPYMLLCLAKGQIYWHEYKMYSRTVFYSVIFASLQEVFYNIFILSLEKYFYMA